MTRDETLDLMRRHVDAWNAHDGDCLLALMTADCVFDASAGPSPHGQRIIGHAALKPAFEAIWSALKDARWEEAVHLVDGDRGVTAWTFRATKPNGDAIEAQGIDVLRFRDGKISHKDTYRKAVTA